MCAQDVANAIGRLTLWLSDFGAAFPGAHLTTEGAFVAPCPVDRRHSFAVLIDDTATPWLACPTCASSPEARRRFTAALNARLPHGGYWIEAPCQTWGPVTGWQRQPDGAPAVALRTLADGRLEWLARPGREADVASWLAR